MAAVAPAEFRHRSHWFKFKPKHKFHRKGKSTRGRERDESASTHLALSTRTDRARRGNRSPTSTTHYPGRLPLPARRLSSAPWIRAFKTSTPNRISGFWLLGVTCGARECASPENGARGPCSPVWKEC
ncbi:hypothetical protein E2C01_087762 [Portunus trituberculatus]|uniref:Uncharacterized protein n=1 Tax=Portunus trituberculatus TaxID=210409 RepID=A0A5B7JCI0_PORTR|nr:hypothetical protein [Portunus trituberculatus]